VATTAVQFTYLLHASHVTACQVRSNAPKFNRLYLRHFQTDSLLVFTKIICFSGATKLATTRSAEHLRSNFEILTSTLKIGEEAPPLLGEGAGPNLTQTRPG